MAHANWRLEGEWMKNCTIPLSLRVRRGSATSRLFEVRLPPPKVVSAVTGEPNGRRVRRDGETSCKPLSGQRRPAHG